MEELGQYLRTQRELRKVSLSDISEDTKIAVNWLRSIEDDRWGDLPGKTFAKNFVKSYAKSLGLDVDDVILRYDALMIEGAEPEDSTGELALRPKKRVKWVIAVLLLIVAAAIILLTLF